MSQGPSTELSWANENIRQIVVQSGTSFFWAMRLLPEARRQAVFSIYAFCREVDDIADGNLARSEKHAQLDRWRRQITDLFTDLLTDGHMIKKTVNNAAILIILKDAIKTYGLKQNDFIDVIDGMQMDIDGPIVAPFMEDLLLYCDRVASAVGRLCVPIFGQADEKGRAVADHLGLALQLTNIIRDVPEDADIGRLYLPEDLLVQNGIDTRIPVEVANHPRLAQVCQTLGERAQQAYDAAQMTIDQCDPKAMRAPVIMMQVYYINLKRLRKAGWQPHALLRRGKVKHGMQKLEKLIVALRYSVF